MTSTSSSTAVDPFAAINSPATAASSANSASSATSADTFLKLLVTQMQNQDPLNPMDNSQMTSQLAQINTVTGINTLNTSVQSLNTQFVQMQALQGASLVGHDVTVAGNGLSIENGVGLGGFNLAGPATNVKVDVMDTSGRVVDTLQLGAMSTGVQDFSWPSGGVADGSKYTFRVTANSGAQTVASTALMRDRVDSVSTNGSTLMLDLDRSGLVAYTAVQALN